MLLTEEQAKEKFCPILERVSGLTQKCVASECMAWRWHRSTGTSLTSTKDEMVRRDNGTVYFMPVPPDGEGWRQIIEWEKDKDGGRTHIKAPREAGITSWAQDHYGETNIMGQPSRGYCGLAGQTPP